MISLIDRCSKRKSRRISMERGKRATRRYQTVDRSAGDSWRCECAPSARIIGEQRHLHLGHETTDPTSVDPTSACKKKKREKSGGGLTLVLHNRINGKSTFSNFKA